MRIFALALSSLCQPDKTWEPLLEACTEKPCPQLQDPTNGQVDYVNGSQAHYVCNKGYYLIGTKIRYCELSGTTVEWSGSPPQCEKILCQPPGKISNGRYTNSHKVTFEYNEVVFYTCDPSSGPDEYSLIGENRLICSGHDTWSSHPPECKVVKCEHPVFENGRLVSGAGRKFYYKVMVAVECLPGFYLEGSSIIACGPNSTWEPQMPKCIKVSTPLTTKTTISSVSGVKTVVPTTPPTASQPGLSTLSIESPNDDDNLDGGLIAVIVLIVLLDIAVVGACLYKYLYIRKRA